MNNINNIRFVMTQELIMNELILIAFSELDVFYSNSTLVQSIAY